MNNFFRAIIAGYGAKKLGGGCFGTILVFVLIWVALGQCSFSTRKVPAPETYPADRLAGITVRVPCAAAIICRWRDDMIANGSIYRPTKGQVMSGIPIETPVELQYAGNLKMFPEYGVGSFA